MVTKNVSRPGAARATVSGALLTNYCASYTLRKLRVPGVFSETKGGSASTKWKYKHNWGGNAGGYFLLRCLDEEEGGGKGGRGRGWEGGVGKDAGRGPVHYRVCGWGSLKSWDSSGSGGGGGSPGRLCNEYVRRHQRH